MAQGIAATVGRSGASLCNILIGKFIETHCEATFGIITGLVFGMRPQTVLLQPIIHLLFQLLPV